MSKGSNIFDKYVDSNGLKLVGTKIGGWDPVIANQAFMMSSKKKIAFCLQKNGKAAAFQRLGKYKTTVFMGWVKLFVESNQGIFNYSIGLNFEDS